MNESDRRFWENVTAACFFGIFAIIGLRTALWLFGIWK